MRPQSRRDNSRAIVKIDPQSSIYVAVSRCGGCVKIGISGNVGARVRSVGMVCPSLHPFKLLRSWQSPHSRAVERIIKYEWRHRALHGKEYFSVTPNAAIRKIMRELRACENGKKPPCFGRGVKYAWA